MESAQVKVSYRFGPFLLDQRERQLLRDGRPISLTPKAFDVLRLLLENAGHLLEKETLIDQLWPDAVVEEANLPQCIYMLRKALGENPHQKETRYIETVPRRGYRFVAPVERITAEEAQEATSQAPNGLPKTVENSRQQRHKRRLILLAASAAGILILLTVAALTGRLTSASAPTDRQPPQVLRTVAVLPFESLTSRNTDEFLGVGLADALITKLSESREMNIRPLESVRHYSGTGINPLRAGHELAVDAVLHGNIQREGGKIRVTMRLLNVANGAALWADQVDSTVSDMFAVEDSVAADVQRALVPHVALLTRWPHPPTTNTEAHEDYMRGRFFWSRRTAESLRKSIEFFQQAIAEDPRYAQAYAGLADAYSLLGFYDFLPPAESYPKAKQAALRAVALNDELADAHASLLGIETDYDWDWDSAEKEFQRAVELNPNYATAYQWHAYVHLARGNVQGANADLDRAMQLDPLSPGINISSAWPYYLGRRYDLSIKRCEKTLELYPDFVVARQVLAMGYTQHGEYANATAELRKVQVLDPANPMTELLFGHLYAVSGRRDEAEQALQQVFGSGGKFKIPSYYVAAVYVALGRHDKAFQWLDRAYAERSNWLIYLKLDPRFDALRTDPRFTTVLRQIGL